MPNLPKKRKSLRKKNSLNREYQRARRNAKTLEQQESRRQQLRESDLRRRNEETEDERNQRLQQLREKSPQVIEEGSPMGGGECDESPVHMVEPQIDLSEMEPQVELDEDMDHNLVEPQVELEEGTDHTENHMYPYDNLAVEYYENAEDPSSSTYHAGGSFTGDSSAINGMYDSEDPLNHMNNAEVPMDTNADPSLLKTDDSYNEMMRRSYFEDYIGSSGPTVAENSNSLFDGTPLARFPTIVKCLESAEYETLQILYQLLFQRSAWDTQEILAKRILEFSGFNFSKTSEDYCNREMMLQSLPNNTLVKIGAILCLEQVKSVISNGAIGRRELCDAILRFLASPSIRNRLSKQTNAIEGAEDVESCGCRNKCLRKFVSEERDFLYEYHLQFKEKKKQDQYFMNLITVKKSNKMPNEENKKHREHKYNYKIQLGTKEVSVCKGGFMHVFGLKMSRLNKIQSKLKGSYARNSSIEYPPAPGVVNVVPPVTSAPVVVPVATPPTPVRPIATPSVTTSSVSTPVSTPVATPPFATPSTSITGDDSELNSVEDSSNSSSSKLEVISKEDVLSVDEETRENISQKVPAVVIEKIDPSQISKGDPPACGSGSCSSVKTKLKEFPLVVKSMEVVSEELLIDLHFLLYLNSAEPSKLKKNILEFDGFEFDKETEDYDERKEFLQRMSSKMVTDVAKSFSLAVMNKKEDTILNILSFLMQPEENFLRTAVSVPVILSDVEFDDIEGFSDSDDEIVSCEVVEKKVECIDILSDGEDSGKEVKEDVEVKVEKEDPGYNKNTAPATVPASAPAPMPVPESLPKKPRTLRDFETIRKIVNTHPPEYLLDIYELLYLNKHDPNNADSLRKEILDFKGFDFEKGSADYVKRKQVLDRMLYNNVRRVYNTLIHNSSEVKVFSKPTMINEIFQFLFKLPDTDTSVRPLPPGAKTLTPKPVNATATKTVTTTTPPTSSQEFFIASILPSQTGKLSDLKRVFQRVACFPCEYLVDVHKLLFMSDCDTKVIRQNIFAFKGFSFGVDSAEFQQRKMYLEYLTFHSLRKISSVLTTRSVDLRNSTKHELASHLTEVLAEYCNTHIEVAPPTTTVENTASTITSTAAPATTAASPPVTSVTQSSKPSSVSSAPSVTTPTSTKSTNSTKSGNSLGISIVETHSITSVQSEESPRPGRKRRKNSPVTQPEKKSAPGPTPTPPVSTNDFADIHLPEIEQYKKLYGANLNVYPSVAPTYQISSPLTQTFPQFIPQTMVSAYGQPIGFGQPIMQSIQQSQVLGFQPSITMAAPVPPVINPVKPNEVIVPCEVPEKRKEDTQNKSKDDKSQNKNEPCQEDSEEDGDKPLASLIGHPSDGVIKKHINDIVQSTDLQDLTMNSVIQRVYALYPKFDLSYRKEFIKSTLRTILYKLGEENSEGKEAQNTGSRDSGSPDCSVTTTNNPDNSLPGSPAAVTNS